MPAKARRGRKKKLKGEPTGTSAFRVLLDEEFDDGGHDCDLADPEEEHPFDDFGFECRHFRAEFGDGSFDFGAESGFHGLHLGTKLGAKVQLVGLGHPVFGEGFFLILEGGLETLGDGAGFGRLDAGGFEDREDFDGAHAHEVR